MHPTKKQILQGARVAFAQKGFRATIKDIARAADLASTSIIFWYFGDKDALLLEIVRTASPFAHLEALTEAEPGDPKEELALVVSTYLAAYRDPIERQILLQLLGGATGHEEVRTVLRRHVASITSGYLTGVIRRAQDQLLLERSADPELIAQLLMGELLGMIIRWEVNHSLPWSEETLVRQALRMLGITDGPKSENTGSDQRKHL